MGIENYIKDLPKPLSKEEQQSLINIFYATRRFDVRELLIKHNLRLVAKCVMKYKYQYSDTDLDDLMTAGTLELINVIDNKFDVSKGVSLSTFITKSVSLKLLDEINIKYRSSDALHQPRQNTVLVDNEELEIFNTIPDNDNFAEEIAFRDFINNFMQKLTDYERYLVEHRYEYFGKEIKTLKEISKKYGRSITIVKRDCDILNCRLKKYIQSSKLEEEQETSPEMKNIIEYVKTTKNKNHKFVLEHLYGLNGNKIMNRKEISDRLNCPIQYVYGVLNKLRDSGKIQKAEKLVSNEEVLKYIEICSNKNDIQILELFYGLNGNKKHTRKEIAEIFNKDRKTISDRILKLINNIKTQVNYRTNKIGFKEKERFLYSFYKTLNNEREKTMFTHIYGIDGNKTLKLKEIAGIIGIPYDHAYRLKNIIEERFESYVEDNRNIAIRYKQ